MTQSMTGFARCQTDGLTWEIRSVNQRYLEPSFKIPDVFRALESSLRQRLRRRLHRGKIDCLLRFDGDHITGTKINEENLRELRGLMEAVHRVVPDASRPSALDIVRWPGVLDQTPVDEVRLFEKANGLFDEALTGLIEMRRREGHELNQAITVLISNLAKEVTHITANVHTVSQHQSERLRDRLAEAAVEADPGRLEQELVFLLQKSDIREELDRLHAHIEEVRTALSSTEPSGRRLDFLMQELNREANTIASKCASIDASNHAVQMKVLIEQMREQIQNIE